MNNQNIYKYDISFKDNNYPIEIFCKEKYQNYYIRGQIIELSAENYPILVRDADVTYHIVVFVLANNKHFSKFIPSDMVLNSELGLFFASNPQDFSEIQKIQDSMFHPLARQALGYKGINSNPIILANQNDVPIPDNQYLKDSIESKKDIILLDLHAYVNNFELDLPYDAPWPEMQVNFMSNYFNRIHALCGYQFSNESEYVNNKFIAWLDHLYEIIYWNFDYQYLEKQKFFDILFNIGGLSYQWIKYRRITGEYLKLLNTFKNKIDIDGDLFPLKKFCYSFFNDLLQNLETTEIITKCEYCHDYFPYKKNKKYCSLKSEGKDCGEKARNKRFYKAHKDTILPNARKTTRELRNWYKEKGIKN